MEPRLKLVTRLQFVSYGGIYECSHSSAEQGHANLGLVLWKEGHL